MIELRKINEADARAQWTYTTKLPADENGLTNPFSGVSWEEYRETVLPKLISYEHPVDMSDWFVPETYYYLWDDDRLVGEFRIRHYLTDALRNGAGHIGYSIGKEYRDRGYGTQGLALTLQIASGIVPEDEIYLRVNKDNIASRRVMEKNGARMAGEDEAHFFMRIARKKERKSIHQQIRSYGDKRMLRLEKINGKNVWDILKLEVSDEQKDFVADNHISIIEAYTAITGNGYAFPFGIYEDDIPVGFLMIGFDIDDYWDDAPEIAKGNYNLWRLMIDKAYQGKGLGRKAVSLALDFIRTLPCGSAEYCWLSYEPENDVARQLYNSFGFTETGAKDGEEIIAVLKL